MAIFLSANEQSNWDDNKFSLPHNFPFFFAFCLTAVSENEIFLLLYIFFGFILTPPMYLSPTIIIIIYTLVNVNIFSCAAFKASVLATNVEIMTPHFPLDIDGSFLKE